ncbi:mRNA-decapping enzyme subunit 2, partial [Rhizoclosmatium hyalinum]
MAAFQRMNFHEVLEDLQSRFIINVPVDELSSVERICFQIEQAHWFYEDFVREVHPSLPSLSLKNFSAHFFKECPILVNWAGDHEQAFATFMEYKVRVPVCGAIILNETLDKVLLVRGWKSKSGWGFPKGKINKEEPEADCAVREVYEETGFDIRSRLHVNEHVERTMKEQRIRLYIIRGVPEQTVFLTQTRKEIGDIRWFPLKDLPGYKNADPSYAGNVSGSKFYMVTAFVASLKKWIHKYKRTKKNTGKEPKQAGSKPGLLTVHGGGNTGYKSQTENESENEAMLSDTGLGFNNQDNEDWGVNTLTQATDLLKNLIGIGSSSSDLASIPSSVNIAQYGSSSESGLYNSSHLGGYSQPLPMSYPTQYVQQQQQYLQPTNTLPLQGIITTADGTNTHAMIQILPLPAQNQPQFQQPVHHNVQTPHRSNSGSSNIDVTSLQRESLLELLKGGTVQQPRKPSLKDLPAPPAVKPNAEVMSDEIRASYGGGGGGPSARFSNSASANTLVPDEASALRGSLQKNALLNILTKGPDSSVRSPGGPPSGGLTPTSNIHPIRTPVPQDFQEKSNQLRRQSTPLTSLPPPPFQPSLQPLPTSTSAPANPLLSLLMHGSNQAPPTLPPATLKSENGKLKPSNDPSTPTAPVAHPHTVEPDVKRPG